MSFFWKGKKRYDERQARRAAGHQAETSAPRRTRGPRKAAGRSRASRCFFPVPTSPADGGSGVYRSICPPFGSSRGSTEASSSSGNLA